MKRTVAVCLVLSALLAFGAEKNGGTSGSTSRTATEITPSTTESQDAIRIEGEQRFRTNCGRCHQAPHKFPPRMMGTIVRHMRVRAMLTDEDMKAILAYMTE